MVARNIHTAFLATAVVLLAWPDVKLPQRYITGFRSIGKQEISGVLRPTVVSKCMSTEELLKDADEKMMKLCRTTR